MATVTNRVWTPNCEELNSLYKKMHNGRDKTSAPFAVNVCLEPLAQVTAETAKTCYANFLDAFGKQPEIDRNHFAEYVFSRVTSDFPFHWCKLGLYTNYEKMLDISLQRDEWDKIPEILQKMPADALEKCRAKTVIRAASMGQSDLVRLCFETGTISVDDFGIAITKSSYKKETAFSITQFLLQKAASEGKTISEKARGDAIQGACGDLPRLEMLLEDGPITEGARSSALTIAARSVEPNGRPDIVKKLLVNGPISDEGYKDAVEVTISSGHFDVFTLLHSHNPILCNVIAGVYLGRRKNSTTLSEREEQIVFNGSELSEKIRQASIDYASDENPKLVDYLKKGISEAVKEEK